MLLWPPLPAWLSRRHRTIEPFRDRTRGLCLCSAVAVAKPFCCRTSRQNAMLTSRFPCVRTQISGVQAFACMKPVEIPRSRCMDRGTGFQQPCPGFLLFRNFRLSCCRLVSLPSVVKDSESASDISSPHSPICTCPAPISSVPQLHPLHNSVPRAAGSPEASPVSSSPSMSTMPKDDQTVLVYPIRTQTLLSTRPWIFTQMTIAV